MQFRTIEKETVGNAPTPFPPGHSNTYCTSPHPFPGLAASGSHDAPSLGPTQMMGFGPHTTIGGQAGITARSLMIVAQPLGARTAQSMAAANTRHCRKSKSKKGEKQGKHNNN